MAVARQRMARGSGKVAVRFARLVEEAPDERLERLMQSRARRPILEGVFLGMPGRLDRQRADGVDAAVLWRITGRPDGQTDDFRLMISGGRARVIRKPAPGEPTPVLTMTIDGVDFLKLVTGGLDPMRGYLGGKIKLAGDIMFAAKLGSMFRVPAPRP